MSQQTIGTPLSVSLRRKLIWIALAFFASCLILIFSFVLNLVELTSNSLMKLEAESIIRQSQQMPNHPLPKSHTLSAWRDWQEIPASIRQHFDQKELLQGDPLEVELETNSGDFEYIYLLRHHSPDYGTLYLSSYHKGSEIEVIYNHFFNAALAQSFTITLLILTILFLVIAWLLKRSLEPLTQLSQWANQLNQSPEQAIDIQFTVQELNQIADQLREGVEKVRAANEREQLFLKYSSHELRTPLAVIQASLDTLNLQTDTASPASRSVQRALKASDRMIQLSNALLWIAREKDKTIAKEQLDVEILCQQLIDDHRYLLSNRAIDVKQQISVSKLQIEAPLFSIVLSNLIRNAFQHSSEGTISVQLDNNFLQLSNQIDTTHRDDMDSFGLGLQLVEKICLKLDWTFSFTERDHNVITRVVWQHT